MNANYPAHPSSPLLIFSQSEALALLRPRVQAVEKSMHSFPGERSRECKAEMQRDIGVSLMPRDAVPVLEPVMLMLGIW